MADRPSAVYLHIGHNKTGSSFLQSALALSDSTLDAHGFCYPIRPKDARAARQGLFNGGNLHATPGAFAKLIASGAVAANKPLLISSESFFFHLLRDGPAFLEEYQSACPDVPLHVLLYIRNPLDHAVSHYHQKIKRGGFSGTLAASLQRYNIPARVLQLLELLHQFGAHVSVLNYSRHRNDLINTLERWLALPENTLSVPQNTQVNRSLSRSELELQRAFNTQFGEQARLLVADALCDALPHIRSENPPLARADLQDFLTKMSALIDADAFRALIPEPERLWVGQLSDHAARFPDPDANPDLSFTAEQIEVVVKSLSKHLRQGGFRTESGKTSGPKKRAKTAQ